MVVVVFASAACQAQPPYGWMDDRTGTLLSPDGRLCSASNGPNQTIRTTKHCVVDGTKQLRYQGRLMNVLSVSVDGENIVVSVDGDIGPALKVGKPPKVGDEVWLVGNPIGLPQMLRRGMVSGIGP